MSIPDAAPVADVTAERPDEIAWHALTPDDALARLGTRASGLTGAEAAERLARYGPNELQALEGTSAWRTFVE